jgi:hypothetical protein
MSSRYQNIKKIQTFDSNVYKDGINYYKPNFYPTIESTENDIYIETDIGDRLDIIANQFYNDVNLYWIIACANPDKIDFGSLFLEPGLQLVIPTDINNILSEYNRLNNI